MERTISTKKYLLAFVLTLIIFAGGIFIGVLFENVRLSYSQQTILNEKVNLRSLQLQQNYIDSRLADCTTLNHILEVNINELGKKMAEVIDYEKRALLNSEEFNLQLQDYFLTEIQFLLTSQEIDKKCDKKNLKILFFYDEDKYDTQGDILGYLKKIFGARMLIFSFDSNFKQEPMINILLTSHKITSFPTVVIEGKAYQGHREVGELMEIVCKEFGSLNSTIPEPCVSKATGISKTTLES